MWKEIFFVLKNALGSARLECFMRKEIFFVFKKRARIVFFNPNSFVLMVQLEKLFQEKCAVKLETNGNVMTTLFQK
jgi:hypothetical protein